jgi:hypothetical protein
MVMHEEKAVVRKAPNPTIKKNFFIISFDSLLELTDKMSWLSGMD